MKKSQMHREVLSALLWWVTHDEKLRKQLTREIRTSLSCPHDAVATTLDELYEEACTEGKR